MKKWTLSANIILDNFLSNLVFFVFVILLAYLLQGLSGLYVAYTQRLHLADQYQLKDRLLIHYAPHDTHNLFDWIDLSTYREDVMSMEGVRHFEPVSAFEIYAPLFQVKVVLRLEPFFSDVDTGLRYSLTEGSWPSAPNEVVLPEFAKKYVQIGDRFSAPLDIIQKDMSIQSSDAEITIVGFLDAKSLLFLFCDLPNHPDLSDVTKTLSEWSQYQNAFEHREMYGFILDPTDARGHKIGPPPVADFYMVRTDPGSDHSLVESELKRLYGDSRVHSGLEMIEKYKENHREDFLLLLRLSVLLFLLTVTALFSFVFLQLNRRKKEMATYYICGASWRQSIFLFCGIYYLMAILGTLIGSALYVALTNLNLSENRHATGWIMLLILVVCTILILPQYLVAVRTAPIEYIRKD